MLGLSENELNKLILEQIPLGSPRGEVERALRRTLHRSWVVADYDTPDYMSGLGFSVPITNGDYYFRSDLVTAPSGPFGSHVITAYILFDSSNRVKDVVVKKWHDAL